MACSHEPHSGPSASPSPQACTVYHQHTLGKSARNIAHDAFQSTMTFLESEFANDKNARDILLGKTNVEDVESTVRAIKDCYERHPRRKWLVGDWLQKLSGRILHYSGVLDALAQHHPEYASLAWGSIKFVLMGIINHAELVEQFARALTCIGYVLPEVKRDSELYITDQMQDAVSAVYAHVISFLLQAASWYKKSCLRRAFSSIIKPFELEYKATVERVKEHSEIIRQIASGESRTEVRDIQVVVHQIQNQMQQELGEMRSQLGSLLKATTTNTAIVKRIDLRVEDVQPRIYDLQYSGIVIALRPSTDPGELLDGSTSLVRRRRMKSHSPCATTTVLSSLKEWAACPTSSLFVLHPGPGAESAAKEVSVSIINHIKSIKQQVFWNLSPLGSDSTVPSVTNVLRSLIFQVVTAKPAVLLRVSHELNVAKFSSTHSDAEWLDLLSLVISRTGGCFLVVECESLYRLRSGSSGWTHRFLKLFHQLADRVQASGSQVKVLVTNFEKSKSRLEGRTGDSPKIVAALKRQTPVPPRRRRKLFQRASHS